MTVAVRLLFCAVCFAVQPAAAEDRKDDPSQPSVVQWETGGSLRLRYEWKQGFALGTPGAIDPQDYLLSQLRLHVKVHHGEQWALFVEGQDARVNTAFLDNNINDTKAANTFADRFDLHQGYMDLGWDAAYGARLRLGRQKFNLGKLRLIASLEWVNTARVWDGARLSQRLGNSDRVLDVFASHLVAVRPRSFNTHATTGNRMFDSQFYGTYLTDSVSIPDSRFELYYLLRRNTRVGDRVHTFGLRYAWKADGWDADGEAMAQTGRFDFLQHQAYAGHVGLGRQLDDNLHLGLAYNYGSGDSSSTDGRHQTFDNLYPLNHAYYGYMDLFSLQNIHNVESVLSWKTLGNSTLRLAYEGFWLAKSTSDAWYNAGGGAVRRSATATSAYVGSEIDFTVSTRVRPWPLTMLAGYSYFSAGSYVSQSGTSRDASFFFVQSRYAF